MWLVKTELLGPLWETRVGRTRVAVEVEARPAQCQTELFTAENLGPRELKQLP